MYKWLGTYIGNYSVMDDWVKFHYLPNSRLAIQIGGCWPWKHDNIRGKNMLNNNLGISRIRCSFINNIWKLEIFVAFNFEVEKHLRQKRLPLSKFKLYLCSSYFFNDVLCLFYVFKFNYVFFWIIFSNFLSLATEYSGIYRGKFGNFWIVNC